MKRIAALLLVLFAASSVLAGDWSHWRGPEQTGVSREKDLPEKFALKDNTNVIWRAAYGGRSTPLVQNGRVCIINKVGEGLTEQERVMCFDDANGKVVWEHRFNVWHAEIASVRLGWTNLAGDPETGNVYAHGTQGLLMCFDGKDGKVLWQHSLTEEYGRVSGYGGRVTSPIIDGDLLLLGMMNASWGYQGMGRTRFVAFDKKTGQVVWWASTGFPPRDTYYSCPVVAVIGGERLLVSGGGDGGVHAFKVRTGEKVWSYIFGPSGVNPSPVVDGDLVYIAHGDEVGNVQGRVICLNGAKVKEGKPELVWKVDGIKAKYASPVLDKDNNRLYICDELAQLYCLDAKTGAKQWDQQYGKNTRGSPVLADGKLYLAEVNSKFHILQPGTDGFKVLHSQFFRKAAGAADVEINGSPAVANGRVYFMTSNELFCIGKKDHTAKASPIPPQPKETPIAEGDKPTFLQVVPADVVLYPGQDVKLKVRAYNKNGQLLKDEVEAEWSLAGPRPPEGLPPPPKDAKPAPPPPALVADLSSTKGHEVTLTAKGPPPAQFGRVIAKAGDLTGEVRVRMVPKLPYAPNFANVPEGRTPGAWVNCQGKFAIGIVGEKKVLKKRADNGNALVAQANTFFGPPDMKDYTIEADIQGTKVRGDMPDVGIIANRYTLMLAGNARSLRIVSWETTPPRVDRTIDFPWKPGVWYRMKFTVEVNGDKGTVRGKVWPRDTAEPENWTIEFVDPVPNREGSPGIYGFSTGILQGTSGSEIYYDNVKVTPNKK